MSRDLSDETVVARIIGAAARHARRCALSETGHLAAVTEIAGLAGGRADLLAQGAGIAAGFHCGRADEARYLRAAQLCIEAGADTGQAHRWCRFSSLTLATCIERAGGHRQAQSH